jgi:hypothetical protein
MFCLLRSAGMLSVCDGGWWIQYGRINEVPPLVVDG